MSFPTSFTTPKRDAFLQYGPGGPQLEKVLRISAQYVKDIRAELENDSAPSSSINSSPLALNRHQWRTEVRSRKSKVLSLDSVRQHVLNPLLEGKSADLAALLEPWATVLRDIPMDLVERHKQGKEAETPEAGRGPPAMSDMPSVSLDHPAIATLYSFDRPIASERSQSRITRWRRLRLRRELSIERPPGELDRTPFPRQTDCEVPPVGDALPHTRHSDPPLCPHHPACAELAVFHKHSENQLTSQQGPTSATARWRQRESE